MRLMKTVAETAISCNFMQFHAISNFGFAFGLQTVFMLSFFVPWHALFASTHFVAFTCQMDFVAKAPCVLALLVQGAKAGALLDRVPCFMRGDVPKWCHSSKSFFFLFFSLFQNLLEKKLRSKPRSPTSTPNQQHRPQGRIHLWSWIMKHV